MRNWARPLWYRIHRRPLKGQPGTARYYHDLTGQILCETCQQHWKELLLTSPPPPDEQPLQQFAWSVRVHNSVNSRLGYRRYPLWQAWLRYGIGNLLLQRAEGNNRQADLPSTSAEEQSLERQYIAVSIVCLLVVILLIGLVLASIYFT
jgi:hypothetical protein